MNDVSSPAHFYRWKPRDAQGRWTANLIIWIIYYHCSPLSHKADLTHFRLLIDRFLFFVSCNIGMLTMKHSGDYIRSILSRLSSHTGVRGWVDRAQQELSPAAWGGEWWLLDLVLRERRDPVSVGHVLEEGMTATAGSSVGKMMKAELTGDRTAAQLRHAVGNLQCTFRNWLWFQAVV